jgi:hypothetical protein
VRAAAAAYSKKRNALPAVKAKVSAKSRELWASGYRSPHVSDARKRYLKTPAGQEARRRYKERHALRVKARNAVRNAIASGRLLRQPCRLCGKKAEAHHHAGYTRPNWLNVEWLCKKHHLAGHGADTSAL